MSPASWRDSVDGHCHCFLFVSRLRMYRACIDEDGPNAPESHVSDRRVRRLTCLQVSSELLTDFYRFLQILTCENTIHNSFRNSFFSPNSPFHIRISSRNMLLQRCWNASTPATLIFWLSGKVSSTWVLPSMLGSKCTTVLTSQQVSIAGSLLVGSKHTLKMFNLIAKPMQLVLMAC